VVLDSKLRLPVEGRLAATASTTPLWLVTGEAAPQDRADALAARGAQVLRAASSGSTLDLSAALRLLAERGITRVMVEAGPILSAALVRADLVDEAVVFRSPNPIGSDGIDALEGLTLEALTGSPHLRPTGRESIGDDTVEFFERP
jgi:diaminohydroxyphosphoribosylaminopyrimidine deaminase/5-amino-6-(5-phosphoribosylamino)uracil reductase